jgi:monoamine oxidase
VLEFGGSWITPWQERIRHYARLTGIELRPTHPITERRYHDGKVLRIDLPCEAKARFGYDRTMTLIRADTERYGSGEAFDEEGRPLAAVPLNGYLDRIDASPESRIQVLAWWAISGNGDPDRISAAEFLSSCAYGGGAPEGMMTALAHTLVPGAGILVERMIARSGAELRLGAAVKKVTATARGFTLTLSPEDEVRARAVLLCIPLNAIGAIEYDPPLDERRRDAVAIGHGGRSIKIWIKARGPLVGTLSTGGSDGIRWLFAERASNDGGTLLVGFSLADDDFDPASCADVAGSLHRFFPEAELMAWDWHDWVGDPWARGTWVALPHNALWIADHQLWRPEGRLTFASSDYAPQSPGWFEAAIGAGEEAAAGILVKGCLG